MFQFGHFELIMVLVVIFILFGHRLPSVMRSFGRDVVGLPHDAETQRQNAGVDWLIIPLLMGLLIALVIALLSRPH